MHSTAHPIFESKDILQAIFFQADPSDFTNIQLVCRLWYQISEIVKVIKERNDFFHEINLTHSTINSFNSPNLVYHRLSKIYERRHAAESNEAYLFEIYCAGGTVDNYLLHLVDTDFTWLNRDFHDFEIESLFRNACMVGNLPLVNYLIENKNCKPTLLHLKAAVNSGALDLVIYLLEEQIFVLQDIWDISDAAILSGKVSLIYYLTEKYKAWPQKYNDINNAVISGSVEMVKLIHQKYRREPEIIDTSAMIKSRNLQVIKYVIERIGYQSDIALEESVDPIYQLRRGIYGTGDVALIEYIDEIIPCEKTERFPLLQYAIQSGSVMALRYFIENRCAKKLSAESDSTKSDLLCLAVKSGSTNMVSELVTLLKIPPKSFSKITLFDSAIMATSTKVKMFRYIEDEQKYDLSQHYSFYDSYNCKSIELIAYLRKKRPQLAMPLSDTNERPWHSLSHYCGELIVAYHLILSGECLVNSGLLEAVFAKYLQYSSDRSATLSEFNNKHDDKIHFIYLFMKYLIDVHHLQPTEEMMSKTACVEDKANKQSCSFRP